MRLVFFIISLFVLTSSYAVREIPNLVIHISNDGVKSSFKQKKYQHRHFIANKRKISKHKSLLAPLQSDNLKSRTKGKAILMAVLTGPIGGHRLYLGTKPYVPIVYALTLGGGLGFLPLIDIVAILLTKDISKYYDNSQIMMW